MDTSSAINTHPAHAAAVLVRSCNHAAASWTDAFSHLGHDMWMGAVASPGMPPNTTNAAFAAAHLLSI